MPTGYFSILSELSIILIAPLEALGYRLPARMVPDISSGRILCEWLRSEKGVDTYTLPTYWHRYEDGRQVPAKLFLNRCWATCGLTCAKSGSRSTRPTTSGSGTATRLIPAQAVLRAEAEAAGCLTQNKKGRAPRERDRATCLVESADYPKAQTPLDISTSDPRLPPATFSGLAANA